MKIKALLKQGKAWIMPLCFIFSAFINLGFYYLGLAFKDNLARTAGFLLGSVLFALLCGLTVLTVLRQARFSNRTWLFLAAVPLFFAVCFGASLVKHGMNGTVVSMLGKCVILAMPSFLAGICGAVWRTEGSFFQVMEKLSFFSFPAALIYLNGALFNCNPFNYGRNLGMIGYMTFAYTIMPVLLAHITQFADRAPMELPFHKRPVRRPQLLRGVFIAVYWLAIIASGTRGTYVCVGCFCALLVLSRLIHREAVKPAFFLSAVMAAVLLFNMFIYALPGFYAVQRMNMFLEGLKQGELVTAKEDEIVRDRLDDLVKDNSGEQIANRPENPDNPPVDPNQPSQPGENDIAEENLQIGNRGTLFKLAFKEFLKSPLTGMGAMAYTIKYGMYPHSVILELLCETGLVGFVILMGLILYALIRLLLIGWKNREVRYFLLFLLAFAVKANISGALWDCAPLLCALGYGIAVSPLEKAAPCREGIQ